MTIDGRLTNMEELKRIKSGLKMSGVVLLIGLAVVLAAGFGKATILIIWFFTPVLLTSFVFRIFIPYVQNKEMKIFVTVKTNSRNNNIIQINDNHFEVRLKEVARENRANVVLVRLLAEYFKMPKSSLKIIKGQKAKTKTIEVVNRCL
ncbi:DUF167 domain-containing protein [Candidatus Saccharibacteria bacterium]|nr:DUF167 domain-containing protein [Candidatus Saccharibacteria bacterium]HOR23422.1 DUF167 domain-containing protein [Candidatus Saccharibacteria bacterium]HPW48146.1 DUF167 domain-containing protein [Candidatus Saccharibacteria bacterium]